MPRHVTTGCGARHRFSRIGGAAKGIPKYVLRPSALRLPATRPVSILTGSPAIGVISCARTTTSDTAIVAPTMISLVDDARTPPAMALSPLLVGAAIEPCAVATPSMWSDGITCVRQLNAVDTRPPDRTHRRSTA